MKKLLLGVVFSALLLIPVASQTAFAGGGNPFDGEDNTVWVNCIVFSGQTGFCNPLSTGPSTFDLAFPEATWDCVTPTQSDCIITVPNFVDPLPLKLIHITTDFAEVDGIDCFDSTVTAGIRDSTEPNGPDGVVEEWRCEPNPDLEDIFISFVRNEVSFVKIHTVSKDVPPPPPPVVGGEIISIDATSLLLAGLQSSAIWMLPVLAGAAGVGAFYLKSRIHKE